LAIRTVWHSLNESRYMLYISRLKLKTLVSHLIFVYGQKL